MKKSVLLIVVLLVGRISYAQVSFSYDLDGNMTRRIVATVLRSAKVDTTRQENKPILEQLKEQTIIFYPNPTKGVFKIKITPLDSKVYNQFVLYSLKGNQLLCQKLKEELTEVDISEYATGVYLLDVILGDKISRWKIIKE